MRFLNSALLLLLTASAALAQSTPAAVEAAAQARLPLRQLSLLDDYPARIVGSSYLAEMMQAELARTEPKAQ